MKALNHIDLNQKTCGKTADSSGLSRSDLVLSSRNSVSRGKNIG